MSRNSKPSYILTMDNENLVEVAAYHQDIINRKVVPSNYVAKQTIQTFRGKALEIKEDTDNKQINENSIPEQSQSICGSVEKNIQFIQQLNEKGFLKFINDIATDQEEKRFREREEKLREKANVLEKAYQKIKKSKTSNASPGSENLEVKNARELAKQAKDTANKAALQLMSLLNAKTHLEEYKKFAASAQEAQQKMATARQENKFAEVLCLAEEATESAKSVIKAAKQATHCALKVLHGIQTADQKEEKTDSPENPALQQLTALAQKDTYEGTIQNLVSTEVKEQGGILSDPENQQDETIQTRLSQAKTIAQTLTTSNTPLYDEMEREINKARPPLAYEYIRGCTHDDLSDIIVNTKVPHLFAESEVYGDGRDWNDRELKILGGIGVAVDVDFFDDGEWHHPIAHRKPIPGTLLYIPGALLECKGSRDMGRLGGGEPSPEMRSLVKGFTEKEQELPKEPQVTTKETKKIEGGLELDDAENKAEESVSPFWAWWRDLDQPKEIDVGKFEQLYEERLLPLLLYANEDAKARDEEAIITSSILGGFNFAGIFSGQDPTLIPKLFQNTIRNLLHKHHDKLTHIKLFYLNTHMSPIEGAPDENIGSIQLQIRQAEFRDMPEGSKPPQRVTNTPLRAPEAFEIKGEWGSSKKRRVYSIVGWDQVSRPGNEGNKGTRGTDDGVKFCGTDSGKRLTGYPGHYNQQQKKYLPGSPGDNYNWKDVIAQKKVPLIAKGRTYISKQTEKGIELQLLSGNEPVPQSPTDHPAYLSKSKPEEKLDKAIELLERKNKTHDVQEEKKSVPTTTEPSSPPENEKTPLLSETQPSDSTDSTVQKDKGKSSLVMNNVRLLEEHLEEDSAVWWGPSLSSSVWSILASDVYRIIHATEIEERNQALNDLDQHMKLITPSLWKEVVGPTLLTAFVFGLIGAFGGGLLGVTIQAMSEDTLPREVIKNLFLGLYTNTEFQQAAHGAKIGGMVAGGGVSALVAAFSFFKRQPDNETRREEVDAILKGFVHNVRSGPVSTT